MRLFILPLILLFVLEVAVALYLHTSLKRKAKQTGKRRWLVPVFDVVNICVLTTLTVMVFVNFDIWWKMWLMYGVLSIFFAELIGSFVTIIGCIPRLFKKAAWPHFGTIGLIAGAAVFCVMWYDAMVTRLTPRVERLDIEIPGLPQRFNGYRVVQLSDLHVGTLGANKAFLEKIVEMVNNLHPDLIVFTGDIINSRASELESFTTILSKFEAPDGVISILGNHDYGDYTHWAEEQQKLNDRAWLRTMQKDMGWTLLRDSTVTISRGNEAIYIVGVENIGEPPFTAYGSLARAAMTAPATGTKILLSHNPMHWNDSVKNHKDMDYALTLSGHTHAMQMRYGHWTPAKYKYPQYAGLYTDTLGRQIYVNIGAGTVGMPVRFGNANPEITLLTLRSLNKPEKKN